MTDGSSPSLVIKNTFFHFVGEEEPIRSLARSRSEPTLIEGASPEAEQSEQAAALKGSMFDGRRCHQRELSMLVGGATAKKADDDEDEIRSSAGTTVGERSPSSSPSSPRARQSVSWQELLDEEEEQQLALDEGGTSKRHRKRSRPCKEKRKRRCQLKEKLSAVALADPSNFDFDSLELPPGVQQDEAALLKLKEHLRDIVRRAMAGQRAPCAEQSP